MSGFHVGTGDLRTRAEQVAVHVDTTVPRMAAYCRTHCGNIAGLDGPLAAAERTVTRMSDYMLAMFPRVRTALADFGSALAATADQYDRAEEKAAEALRKLAAEHDVAVPVIGPDTADIPASATGPTLVEPEEHPQAQHARRALHEDFGTINTVVRTLTGLDVLARVDPLLLGEWGRLRTVADAWGQLETAFRALGEDLVEGQRQTASTWEGGASAGADLDRRAREDWEALCERLARICGEFGRLCASMHALYQDTVKDLLFLVGFYTRRVRALLERVPDVRRSADLKQTVVLLTELLLTLWTLIENQEALLADEYDKYRQSVEALIA